ncbi:MAG: YjjG family noncanonical pyrimidine nucleotidase, partial [Clostridia bacterium]|nr:YjjG family noncanonical pyrimidine nucleotidase [Clostridia bacterium]
HLGFEKCGTIYVRDHSPRIAYQLTRRKKDALLHQNDAIKVVFVDIDNTLLSFEEYVKWAMKEGFEKFGFLPYEPYMFDVFQRINTDFWLRHEKGEITFQDIQDKRWGKIFETLGIDNDGKEFEEYFRTKIFDNAILEPHAKEMLEYLHGRYILATASNGPYEQQKHRLEIAGLAKYFDFVFVSEAVGVQKPEKAFFDRCFEFMKKRGVSVEPCECMIIGDSLTSDMAGGKNAGIKTCYFTRGKELDKKPDSVDFVVTTLDEVENIL